VSNKHFIAGFASGLAEASQLEKQALIPTKLLVQSFTAGIKGMGARQAMKGSVMSTLKGTHTSRSMMGTLQRTPKMSRTQLLTSEMKRRGLRFGGRQMGTPATYRSSAGQISARFGGKPKPVAAPKPPSKAGKSPTTVDTGSAVAPGGFKPGWGTVGLAGLGAYLYGSSS